MTLVMLIVGLFVAFVAASFAYLLKVESDPALKYWTYGWLAIFVFAGLGTLARLIGMSDQDIVFTIPIYLAATALPFFLWAAAFEFVGRPIPVWLPRFAMASCVLRTGFAAAGLDVVSQLLVPPTEIVAWLGGAALFLGALPRTPHKAIAVALALSYAGAAGWEGLGAASTVGQWPGPDRLIFYGSVVAFVLVIVQLLAVLSRVRDREKESWRQRERDLETLRRVAAQGVLQHDTHELVRAVLECACEAVRPDVAGVWLVDEDDEGLRCVAQSGLSDELRATFDFIALDRPEARAALGLKRPFVSERLESDDRVEALGRLEESGGLQGAIAIPMEWGGERRGFFFAGRRPPRGLEDADRRLLVAIAEELSLGVRHLRAVEHLASERRTLRSVLETSPVGVVVQDGDGRIAMLSRLAARLFDCGEPADWLGCDLNDWVDSLLPRLRDPRSAAHRIDVALTTSATDSFELVFDAPEERCLVISTNPVQSADGDRLGRIWVAHDVTEERRLSEQLRQSQKLDTLGRLAGGVAHDFNNQLTAILGNARLVSARVVGDAMASESMADLERAAEHCAKLTRSLLSFSRRTPLTMRPVEVQGLLEEVGELLRPLVPSDVSLRVEVSSEVDLIAADLTQIQQVLLNLVMNACDAIEGNGEVRIHARNAAPPAALVSSESERWVCFSVRDTGVGMPPSTVERVFEPFFTTKPVGEGTGLGLAIAYGVVSAHGGAIEVESRVDEGTTFHVYLPSAVEAAEPVDEARQEKEVRGSELVLVADDESGVRRLARRALERCGFQVLEARDGEEACRLFEAHADEIGLVFLDLTMPRRNGVEVLRAIRAAGSHVPVLLSSGHPSEILDDVGEIIDFIAKPYDPDELTRRVRALLDLR